MPSRREALALDQAAQLRPIPDYASINEVGEPHPSAVALLRERITSIEKTRAERLERAPDSGPHAMVRLLARVIGIGIETGRKTRLRDLGGFRIIGGPTLLFE
jgi:hypothetical protein